MKKAIETHSDQNQEFLKVENIVKNYTNGEVVTHVLKDISLSISKGEMIAILGASGSGKTTLLNILGGIDLPTSGKVLFKGKDFSKAKEKNLTEYRRNNVGFVFQSYNLMPNLTAIENVDFIASLSKNPIDSSDVLKKVNMYEYKDKYPSHLSGGQQQRVSIARALVKNTDLILADEPTAALDFANSIEVLSILESIVYNGSTIIMVTHNEEIAKMANKVVRIRDGLIAEMIENKSPKQAISLKW